jgi:ATP-binding cassette, subfamily B, multidrug efflux pump
MNWFYKWLEGRVDSFPPVKPEQPAPTTWGFIRFYSRPFYPLLAVGLILSVTLAVMEVVLYSYVGKLVDVLQTADRATFWDDNKVWLLSCAAVAVLLMPILTISADAVENQGLRGNFAMRIRWLAHRYLLRQSMEFFQNEFAGRVSTKMMQAAMGVRDVVMKLTQVAAWVLTFFITAVASFAVVDWRLAIPMTLWLAGYGVAIYIFVPKLGKLSERQADMRSLVTGRVVDTYTNIPTVKLFAHTSREDDYAKEGMSWMLESVYKSMRVSTSMNATLNILNSLLLTSTAAVATWLWYYQQISVGAIAFATGLVYRMLGMAFWLIWEMASLFEDFGVVKDGVDVIARQQTVVDKSNAPALLITKGEVLFDNVHFNYGKPLGSTGHEVIAGLTLKLGGAFRCRQVDNC